MSKVKMKRPSDIFRMMEDQTVRVYRLADSARKRTPLGLLDRRRPAIAEAEPEPNFQTIAWGGLSWLDIQKPSLKDTRYLGEHFPFHHLHLEDCLSRLQRPKIDEDPDYLFLVLHFPVFDSEMRVSIPSQVAIFVGVDYVVTLHQGDLKPLVKLFHDCQANEGVRQETMGRGSGLLLYHVLDVLIDYCFPILNKIILNVERVEDLIFDKKPYQPTLELSVVRRDIIAFRRIVRPQIGVIKSLEHKDHPFLRGLEVYFSDVGDHVDRMWDILEDYKEVVEGLSDANFTLSTDRTNDIIKGATVIGTILLPMVVVASLWGMNVRLPFADHSWAFGFIVGGTLAFTAAMLLYFWRRRWV